MATNHSSGVLIVNIIFPVIDKVLQVWSSDGVIHQDL